MLPVTCMSGKSLSSGYGTWSDSAKILGELMVGADPQNLDVQRLELTVIGLPGRQVGHSSRSEINSIEFDEHQLLPLELAQANLFPHRTGQREVRAGSPTPWGISRPPGCRHAGHHRHPGERARPTPSDRLGCFWRVSMSLSLS